MNSQTSPSPSHDAREEAHGVVTAPDTIRFERLLPGPIERVWAYLTDSEKRGKWLATGATEPRAGGSVEFHFKHADLSAEKETPERWKECENGVSFSGTVTRYEPPHVLAYTWPEESGDESEVTFELFERGGDVLLVLTHRRLADRKTMVGVAGGWHTHLGVLSDNLRGVEPRPFWTNAARNDAVYEQRLGNERF